MFELKKRPLRLDSALQELTLYEAAIEYESLGAIVVRIFEENHLLPGVILTQKGHFIGLISRWRFFEYMSRPYSLELFLKRPIHVLYQFTQTQTLVFSGETSIVAAARQALQRSLEFLKEPIVVQLGHKTYKMLDMQQLLLAQSQIQELTMEALQESQKALFQEKEKAQVTLQSVGDAVITTDALGCIEFLNPVAEKLTGWQVQDAKSLPLIEVFKIVNENSREPVKNPVETVLKEGKIETLANQTILIARDGREFAIDDSAAPIRAKDGQLIGAILVFRDVTHERNLTRQLSWQASHDALTGLFNRREFEQQLKQVLINAKKHKQKHTLCYLDLDRFKIVNDTCGHIAGDELLRQVTHLLQMHLRQTDILARLGGDEFGLLLYRCPLEQARRLANALRESIQEFQFAWQDKTFTIGVSIGLSAIEPESHSADSVLNAADAACYAAKNKGRNCVHVYQSDERELALMQGDMQWSGRITALEEK